MKASISPSTLNDYEYIADPAALTDTGNRFGGGSEWASTKTTGNTVTVTHRNGLGPDRGEQLKNGKLYAFAVRAVNDRGESWLSNRSWATPQGGTVQNDNNGAQQAPPEEEEATEEQSTALLTASLDDAPASHDGTSVFTVRIGFSEDIVTSYRELDDGFDVTDGSITAVKCVDGRSDLWVLTVEPNGDADVTMTLEGGRACTVTGAPCTDDGRTLTGTLTFTVPGPEDEDPPPPPTPLTARIDDFPIQHDGQSNFQVRIAFSEPIANIYRYVDDVASATGGQIGDAKRVDGRSDLWTIRVQPTANGPVTFTLLGGGTCGSDHPAVLCTSDGRALSNTVSIDIFGPTAISVAGAQAVESSGGTIEFVVSLDRGALDTITVDYTTRDGNANAGEDYTTKSGTLTFTVGQRSKTIQINLLDDANNEDNETFELVLSNASGARIADATATGTITE